MLKQACSMLRSEVVTVGRVGRLEAAGEAAWTCTLNKTIARFARLFLLGRGSFCQDPNKDGKLQGVCSGMPCIRLAVAAALPIIIRSA